MDAKEETQLPEALELLIQDDSLQESAASMLDVVLDAAIDNNLLQRIPVVNLILGFGRTAIGIRERLFVKKLCHMLTELGSVPEDQREQTIAEINADPKTEVAVGEKLLYIIERCEDHSAARIIGKLFRAFLNGEITYTDFTRLSSIINRLHSVDLAEFLSTEWMTDDNRHRHPKCVPAWDASMFLGTGLVELNDMDISLVEETDWKALRDGGGQYRVDGAESTVCITELGRKLKAALNSSNDNRSTDQSQ